MLKVHGRPFCYAMVYGTLQSCFVKCFKFAIVLNGKQGNSEKK